MRDNVQRYIVPAVLAAVAILALPSRAYSLSVGTTVIEASAEAEHVNRPPVFDSNTGTSGEVSAEANNLIGTSCTTIRTCQGVLATSGAAQTGTLRAKVEGITTTSTWDLEGSANSTWTTAFVNNSSVTQAYLLDFLIYGGRLLIEANTSGGGGLFSIPGPIASASFNAQISVNGKSVFHAGGTLALSHEDLTWGFTEDGTSLDGVLSAGGLPEHEPSGSYSWDEFSGQVLLGSFDPGEAFTVTYGLGVSILEARGGQWDSGEGDGHLEVQANFADPLEVSAITPAGIHVVPEPSSLMFWSSAMLMGLVYCLLGRSKNLGRR
jgi:hypothetical protein